MTADPSTLNAGNDADVAFTQQIPTYPVYAGQSGSMNVDDELRADIKHQQMWPTVICKKEISFSDGLNSKNLKLTTHLINLSNFIRTIYFLKLAMCVNIYSANTITVFNCVVLCFVVKVNAWFLFFHSRPTNGLSHCDAVKCKRSEAFCVEDGNLVPIHSVTTLVPDGRLFYCSLPW